MTNPLDVVISAAMEHAVAVAQLAVHVQQVDGAPERALPLSAHSRAILDAVAEVRP